MIRIPGLMAHKDLALSVILTVVFTLLLKPGHAAEVKNITSGQSGERGFVQYDLVGKLGKERLMLPS